MNFAINGRTLRQRMKITAINLRYAIHSNHANVTEKNL